MGVKLDICDYGENNSFAARLRWISYHSNTRSEAIVEAMERWRYASLLCRIDPFELYKPAMWLYLEAIITFIEEIYDKPLEALTPGVLSSVAANLHLDVSVDPIAAFITPELGMTYSMTMTLIAADRICNDLWSILRDRGQVC